MTPTVLYNVMLQALLQAEHAKTEVASPTTSIEVEYHNIIMTPFVTRTCTESDEFRSNTLEAEFLGV